MLNFIAHSLGTTRGTWIARGSIVRGIWLRLTYRHQVAKLNRLLFRYLRAKARLAAYERTKNFPA